MRLADPSAENADATRQMLEILHRVEAQTGSELAAYAWFRAEPLPGFGGHPTNFCDKAEQTKCMPISTGSSGYA